MKPPPPAAPIRLVHIVGARPNFMKTAPIVEEIRRFSEEFEQVLVHTGQHYDENMSEVFLRELGLPTPDEWLDVGSGTHAEQTARVMLALEPILLRRRPDLVLVVGDVNSTVAASLVAAKLGIPVGHVEAGLRSFDRSMPEELNRIITDHLARLHFTTEKSAERNLLREGVDPATIHFVGNVMIDSLVKALPRSQSSKVLERLALEPRNYAVVTLHRPSNVDDPETLAEILRALGSLAKQLTVVFAVHPRTRERIRTLGLEVEDARLRMVDPLGYLDFMRLYSNSRVVLTDSGGIQEETTYLGIPCLTLRPNTERPVTVELGTNRLVASRKDEIISAFAAMLRDRVTGRVPPLWDGRASSRIVAALREWAGRNTPEE